MSRPIQLIFFSCLLLSSYVTAIEAMIIESMPAIMEILHKIEIGNGVDTDLTGLWTCEPGTNNIKCSSDSSTENSDQQPTSDTFVNPWFRHMAISPPASDTPQTITLVEIDDQGRISSISVYPDETPISSEDEEFNNNELHGNKRPNLIPDTLDDESINTSQFVPEPVPEATKPHTDKYIPLPAPFVLPPNVKGLSTTTPLPWLDEFLETLKRKSWVDPTFQRPVELPTTTTAPTREALGPIDKFLSQVNISASDILAQRGELVKTIIEKNGRILSVKFVLSFVKSPEQEEFEDMIYPDNELFGDL